MNEEQFEKIERYAHGEMSSQERLRFEAALKTDAELAANVEAYRMIEGEMKDYDQEATLKASLQHIGAGFLSKDEASAAMQHAAEATPARIATMQLKESKYRKRWTVAAAAIIAVVIASAGLYYFVRRPTTSSVADIAILHHGKDSASALSRPDTTPAVSHVQPPAITREDTPDIPSSNTNKKKAPASLSPAELFTQNFTADATPEDKPSVLEDAFDDYEKKNYPDAISAINDADIDLVTRGQQTPPELTKWYAHYYKGISYLAMDSVLKAISELEQAANHPTDSLLQVKAQWYLALGYLKENKVQQAKDILRQIIENNLNKTLQAKAKSLLQELEK